MAVLADIAVRWRYPAMRRRKPLWDPGFPCVIFWSHKAACTALAHWFFAQLGSPQRVRPEFARHGYRGLRIHEYEHGVHNRREGYLAGCVSALRAGRPAIQFVRDPAARAFSGFLGSCRRAAQSREQFWGARVRAEVLAFLQRRDGTQRAAYSFVDYLEWLAQVRAPALDDHVAPQFLGLERVFAPEIVPIESLGEQLARLEQRFGLPALARDAQLLESTHHRAKAGGIAGGALETLLAEPVAPGHYEDTLPPAVATALLAGTRLGARLRVVLADDYLGSGLYPDRPDRQAGFPPP